MFKPNPKKQVELKFVELFGKTHSVEVLGSRMTQEEARRRGIPCGTRDGVYFSEIIVDGEVIATASSRDWRKAYKLLKLEVEKLYTEGTALA